MIRPPQDHAPVWLRRLKILKVIWLSLNLILVLKLFRVSVFQSEKARAQASAQQITASSVEPKRGTIWANSTEGLFPMALNEEKFQVWVVPRNLKNKSQAAYLLAKALSLDAKELFDKINNDKLYIPPIARRLDRVKAQATRDLKLEGVILKSESVRFYPEKETAGQLLGFVNFENKGRYGLEGFYQEELSGYGGFVKGEQDNKGRLISIDQLKPAQDGSDLILYLDQNAQFQAQDLLRKGLEEFAADGAYMIVIDPKTGGVIAMASQPSFDPNRFNELSEQDHSRFLNPISQAVYEPGSTLKPINISIGIDAGLFEPDDVIGNFGKSVVVDGYEINTALDKSYGQETATQILMNSDNVAMVEVSNKIGKERMYEYYSKYGFGRKTGLDLESELSSSILPLARWRPIHQATMAFGQGIALTPIQLVSAWTAIASGGRLLEPHIVKEIVKSDGTRVAIEPKEIGRPITPETAAKVRRMIQAVVEQGQAQKAQVKGYSVGGKTGTAQIAKPEGGYFEDQFNHFFVGMGPIEDPRFVVLTMFHKPKNVKFAEASAGLTSARMLEYLFKYYQIPPTKPVE